MDSSEVLSGQVLLGQWSGELTQTHSNMNKHLVLSGRLATVALQQARFHPKWCCGVCRLFQRRPHRLLDLDVLHLLHGEAGAATGRHAVLRPQEAGLRQRRQQRRKKGRL